MFRKLPDGLGLGHGPQIAAADPGLRAVDGSDPALRYARCGIGAVRHVHAHAARPAGSLPYQRSLREGYLADEELDRRRHRSRHRNGGRARARTAVPRPRRQPLSRPDRPERSGHPRRHPALVLRRARRRGDPCGLGRSLRLAGLVPAPLQVPAARQAAQVAHLAERGCAHARDRRDAPSDRAARERAAVLARHPRQGALHRRARRRSRRHRQDQRLHVSLRPAASLVAGGRSAQARGRARAGSQRGLLPSGARHPRRRWPRGRLHGDRARRIAPMEPARRPAPSCRAAGSRSGTSTAAPWTRSSLGGGSARPGSWPTGYVRSAPSSRKRT